MVSPAADALASPAADVLVSPAASPLVTSAADALVTPTAVRALERRTPNTSGASAPSVTCPPAIGGASTLAELDAITVTKPRPLTSSNCLLLGIPDALVVFAGRQRSMHPPALRERGVGRCCRG